MGELVVRDGTFLGLLAADTALMSEDGTWAMAGRTFHNPKRKLAIHWAMPGRMWLLWAVLSGIYVGAVAWSFGSLDGYRYLVRWGWQGPLAFACLLYLHDRTLGRSSPAAAAAFLLGPVGAVLALVFFAVREAHQVAVYGRTGDLPEQLEVFQGVFLTIACGLAASCLAAISFAWATREEWRHYHARWEGTGERVRQSPPACLAAFDLNHTSTLADLDAAYRAKAKEAHPDRGGSAEEFRKLERQYTLAVKFLERYGRPATAAPAISK